VWWETGEEDGHAGRGASIVPSRLQQQTGIAASPVSGACEDFLQGSQFSACIADLFICNVFNMINVEGFAN